MNQQPFSSNGKLEKAISPEQLTQLVEAILAGKYSWACVLLLRFTGYNPGDYIPYNTYNRLRKQNCEVDRSSINRTDKLKTGNQYSEIDIAGYKLINTSLHLNPGDSEEACVPSLLSNKFNRSI